MHRMVINVTYECLLCQNHPNSLSLYRHKSNCSIQDLDLFLAYTPFATLPVQLEGPHIPQHMGRGFKSKACMHMPLPKICPVLSPASQSKSAGQNMSTQRRTQRWLCGLCPQEAFVPPQLYTMYLGVALNFWYPLMTCRTHSLPEHQHLSATNAS